MFVLKTTSFIKKGEGKPLVFFSFLDKEILGGDVK